VRYFQRSGNGQISHVSNDLNKWEESYVVHGKYVVGLKKIVERQMVDKFLSKNFRRHSTSSIESEGVGGCGVRM